MLQGTPQLGGTGNVVAAIGDQALFLGDRGAAIGAFLGRQDIGRLLGLLDDLHHLGDDLPGALDQNAVAHPQTQPRDLLEIVQRDRGDGDPRTEDRLHLRHRRDRPRPPDRELDFLHDRGRLLGGILVRDAPARAARREAQPLLLSEGVHLHHQPVDRIGQPRY